MARRTLALKRNETMHQLVSTSLLGAWKSGRGTRSRGNTLEALPDPAAIEAIGDEIYLQASLFREFLRSVGVIPPPSLPIFGMPGWRGG